MGWKIIIILNIDVKHNAYYLSRYNASYRCHNQHWRLKLSATLVHTNAMLDVNIWRPPQWESSLSV